jgi:hypothetical protein
VKEGELADIVGKDLAEKIIAQGKGTKEYSGLDLKVGGEGMRGFYDRILPSEVNKFFNKAAWGKARVGRTEIAATNNKVHGEGDFADRVRAKMQANAKKVQAWSLPITPEMRQKALREGMPLFDRAAPTDPNHKALSEFNKEYPGHEVQYDGIQEGFGSYPSTFQLTARAGIADGATFNVKSLDYDVIKAKLDEMVEMRQNKPVTSRKEAGDIPTKKASDSPLGGMPKGAILKVVAANTGGGNYRMGSGDAYLDPMGNIILDNERYAVGEKAYLHNGKFYKTPPKELIEDIKEKIDSATGLINGLKKTMWQIRWKEPRTIIIKKGEKYRGLFGDEAIAEEDFEDLNPKRHANVDDYHQRYVQQVESLIDAPNEQKLLSELYKKELEDNRTFRIGGYLHLDEEGKQLTRAQKIALENYMSSGGALGRTAIESLGRDDLIEQAQIIHGTHIKKNDPKIKSVPNATTPPSQAGKSTPLFKRSEPLDPKAAEYMKKLRSLYTPKGVISEKKTARLIEKYETLTADLKEARLDIYKQQAALEKHIKATLPPAERYRVMHHIKRMASVAGKEARQKRFDFAMEQLENAHIRVEKKRALDGIKKILKSKGPRKTSRGVQSNVGLSREANRLMEHVRVAVKMDPQAALGRILDLYESLDTGNREPTPKELEYVAIYQMFSGLEGKSVEQLQSALSALKALVKEGNMQWKADETKRKEDATKKRDAFYSEITGGAGVPIQETKDAQRKGIWSAISESLSAYDTYHQSWEMLLDKLARKDKSSAPLESKTTEYFSGIVHAATHQESNGTRAQQDILHKKLVEIYGEKKLSKKLAQNSKVINKTGVFRYYKDGNPVEKPLSQNTAYKLWQMFQQPSIQKEMQEHGYTQETLAQLEKFIDKKVMAWAKWQINEFYPEYRKGINDIYSALFYVDMPNIEGYSPISRDYRSQKADDPLLGEGGHFASVLGGAVKSRKKNMRDFNILDGDSVLMKHIVEMEHFKAWGIPMREMRSVLGAEKIQGAIEHHHGKAANRALKQFMDHFASGGVDRATTLNALDKLRSNFVRSALGANVVVFMKQLASVPAYMMDIPTASFATGMVSFFANPMKAYKTLMQSEMMKARYKEGFERDIMLTLRRSSEKALTGTRTIADHLMLMTRLGDRAAIIVGGWSVYQHHKKQFLKNGLSAEDAHAKALLKFERATERSQQAGNVKDLAHFQRLGSLGKLFTMFMTAPASYYRNMSMGMRNIKAGRGSRAENLKRMAMAQFVLPMIFQFIASGFDWEDEKQLRAAIVGPFNGLFIARDALEAFATALLEGRSYFSVGVTPPLSTAQKAVYGGVNINKAITGAGDGDEFVKGLEYFAAVAGYLTGIPVGVAQRTIEGIKAAVEGETERPIRRIMGFSEIESD